MGSLLSTFGANRDEPSIGSQYPTAASSSIWQRKNVNEKRDRRQRHLTEGPSDYGAKDIDGGASDEGVHPIHINIEHDNVDKVINNLHFVSNRTSVSNGTISVGDVDREPASKGITDQNVNNDNASVDEWPSSSSTSAAASAIAAPSAITDSHIRLVKLRILLFEIGGGILEAEMESCIKQKGFGGWKEWLTQNANEVQRYQFYRQIREKVLPIPLPSSWDITFLAFLSKCRALDFPPRKKREADEIRKFRNTLSHDLKSSVDLNTFEEMWGNISNCLLSLTGDPRRVLREIDHVKRLQVDTSPEQQLCLQQSSHASGGNCNCGSTRCDSVLASTDGVANNNHETLESMLLFRFSCWRCGNPRDYKMVCSDSSVSITL